MATDSIGSHENEPCGLACRGSRPAGGSPSSARRVLVSYLFALVRAPVARPVRRSRRRPGGGADRQGEPRRSAPGRPDRVRGDRCHHRTAAHPRCPPHGRGRRPRRGRGPGGDAGADRRRRVRAAAVTGMDRPTGVFGTIAGGASGVVVVSAEAGADAGLVALMQYLRVLIVLASIPLVTSVVSDGGPDGGGIVARGHRPDLAGTALLRGGLRRRRSAREAAAHPLRCVCSARCCSPPRSRSCGPTSCRPTPRLIQDAAFLVIGLQVGLRFSLAQVRLAVRSPAGRRGRDRRDRGGMRADRRGHGGVDRAAVLRLLPRDHPGRPVRGAGGGGADRCGRGLRDVGAGLADLHDAARGAGPGLVRPASPGRPVLYPIALWVPSQNGLLADFPQRHSAIVRRPVSSARRPA